MNKIATDIVTIHKLDLEVKYEFYSGFAGTNWEPPESPCVAAFSVSLCSDPAGQDIYWLLAEDCIEAIEIILLSRELETLREGDPDAKREE